MSRWARKRQYSYMAGVLLIVAIILIVLFVSNRPQPSCFDGLRNQGELGVDCGGVCEAICKGEPAPLKVLWSRIIEVAEGVYDIGSLVENTNTTIGVSRFSYIYRVVDEENLLVGFRSGQTYINPGERFLLFEPLLDTGERIVKRVFIELSPRPVWRRIEQNKKDISILEKTYLREPTPRLEAVLVNNSLEVIDRIEVGTVLSDKDGNVLAISETFADDVLVDEERKIFFTWPEPFGAEAVIFDIYPRVSVF